MDRYVIYWRGAVEVRTDLIKTLKAQGFPVVVLRSSEDMLSQVRRDKPAAIIVDASAGDMELAGRVISLEESFEITEVPLIFFGRRATVVAARLQENYQTCVLVDLPFQTQQLIDKVKQAFQLAEGPRPVNRPRTTVTGVHSRVQTMTNRDPTRLAGTHGGVILATAKSLSDFDDSVLIPVHPQAQALHSALSDITNAGEQLGVHARRVIFAAAAAYSALNRDDEADTVIRAASVFFDHAASQENPRLVTCDFSSPSAIPEREAVAELLKKSAETAHQQFSDPAVGRLLEICSSLLHGNRPLASASDIEQAETVLLAEAVNRACWRNAQWSAHGSYSMLRALRNGTLSTPNSDVSERYARIVAEAMTSATIPTVAAFSPFSLSERGRRLQSVELSLKQAESLYDSRRLQEVQFKDLQPGMLIGRPLVSFDGAIVLEANTRLDRNLVLRIWEMQALRPLHGPVFVVREGE